MTLWNEEVDQTNLLQRNLIGDVMSRSLSIALLAAVLSTSAIAQGGGSAGGPSSGGAAAGAPGSPPSGTAGVSPSTSNPPVGTPGTPGPTSAVGLPGGPGPGSTAVVPNQPPPSAAAAAVTPSGSAGIGSPVQPMSSGGLGPRSALGAGSNGNGSGGNANAQVINDFNPGAVTDRGLDAAANDLAAMASNELRSLVQLFDACTANSHPLERVGKCRAVSLSYRSKFGRGRAIDQSLAELDRVVRFQHMFRTTGIANTEYEDRINDRLRKAVTLSLATNELRERQIQAVGDEPDLTKDVKMAR
jgi:hypothetical protein